MMLGLRRRDEVRLVDHQSEWKIIADKRIAQLWDVLGLLAIDIQHVGSTAIKHIKAKPDMFIAVGLKNMDDLSEVLLRLKKIGFSPISPSKTDALCAIDEEIESGIHTLYIHLLPYNSRMWRENINFRDYMIAFPEKAVAYENLKIALATQHPDSRQAYKEGKIAFFKKHFIEAHLYQEMKQKFEITTFEPIEKGWSSDQKYYLETTCGTYGKKLLLRISDCKEYKRKKSEFEMLKKVETLGIPTPKPVDFGLCNQDENVYQILTWVEGEDLRTVLPKSSVDEQYHLGTKVGTLLRKIHSLPAPDDTLDWEVKFWPKVAEKIDFYNSHPIQSDQADILVKHLQEKRGLLVGRCQTLNHGDVGSSNLILMPNGEVGAIDFSSEDSEYGDPWWEFDAMGSWGEEPYPHFSTGFINGYFSDEVPVMFFEVLAYYFAYAGLTALCNTSVGKQDEVEVGQQHMNNILRWFDHMNNPMPTWYLQD